MKDEIYQALNNYLQTYFTQRDLESTLKLFSDSCSGYGTGFDEKYFNFDEMKTLYTRDIQQVPNKIDFQIYNINTEIFSNQTGHSTCELNLQLHIAQQDLKLNHIRLSIFWIKSTQTWQVSHMHISFPTQEHENDESYPIKELENRNTVLQRLVDERTEKLHIALEEITLLATTDKLTSLHNRHKTQEHLKQEIERSKRYGNKLSIIMIDIDYFKQVNDTYGHDIGDNVLIEFASILSSKIRTTDLCGRWGGEEFLIVCSECSQDETIKLAEKIRTSIESHIFDTVNPDLSLKDLVKNADNAMYRAKESGRNKVCYN